MLKDESFGTPKFMSASPFFILLSEMQIVDHLNPEVFDGSICPKATYCMEGRPLRNITICMCKLFTVLKEIIKQYIVLFK